MKGENWRLGVQLSALPACHKQSSDIQCCRKKAWDEAEQKYTVSGGGKDAVTQRGAEGGKENKWSERAIVGMVWNP